MYTWSYLFLLAIVTNPLAQSKSNSDTAEVRKSKAIHSTSVQKKKKVRHSYGYVTVTSPQKLRSAIRVYFSSEHRSTEYYKVPMKEKLQFRVGKVRLFFIWESGARWNKFKIKKDRTLVVTCVVTKTLSCTHKHTKK